MSTESGEKNKKDSMVNVSSTLEKSSKLGVCIKTLDRTVLFQNSICKKVCGDVVGQKCSTGCLEGLEAHPESPLLDEGMRLRPGIYSHGHLVDAILLNDQEFLTTIFYDKQDLVERKMNSLEALSLTRTEKRVLQLLLEGRTNKEIANLLCVSISTIRTHLTHVYQKLPQDLVDLVELRLKG